MRLTHAFNGKDRSLGVAARKAYRSRDRQGAVLVTALLSLLLPTSAQQTGQAPPTGTARFGTTTQLVVEDVIVKSKDGNPLEGLKPGDFTITEDGKAQKIAIFEYQKLQEQPAEPASAPAPKVAEAAPAEPEKPAVKSVTANQIEPEKPGDLKYRDRRLMVLFFDMTSMPIQDQIRARDSAL